MAPLTWKNVNAPDLSNVSDMMGRGTAGIKGAFDTLGTIAGNINTQNMDEFSRNQMGLAAGYTSLADWDNAVKEGRLNLTSSLLNKDALSFLTGRRDQLFNEEQKRQQLALQQAAAARAASRSGGGSGSGGKVSDAAKTQIAMLMGQANIARAGGDIEGAERLNQQAFELSAANNFYSGIKDTTSVMADFVGDRRKESLSETGSDLYNNFTSWNEARESALATGAKERDLPIIQQGFENASKRAIPTDDEEGKFPDRTFSVDTGSVPVQTAAPTQTPPQRSSAVASALGFSMGIDDAPTAPRANLSFGLGSVEPVGTGNIPTTFTDYYSNPVSEVPVNQNSGPASSALLDQGVLGENFGTRLSQQEAQDSITEVGNIIRQNAATAAEANRTNFNPNLTQNVIRERNRTFEGAKFADPDLVLMSLRDNMQEAQSEGGFKDIRKTLVESTGLTGISDSALHEEIRKLSSENNIDYATAAAVIADSVREGGLFNFGVNDKWDVTAAQEKAARFGRAGGLEELQQKDNAFKTVKSAWDRKVQEYNETINEINKRGNSAGPRLLEKALRLDKEITAMDPARELGRLDPRTFGQEQEAGPRGINIQERPVSSSSTVVSEPNRGLIGNALRTAMESEGINAQPFDTAAAPIAETYGNLLGGLGDIPASWNEASNNTVANLNNRFINRPVNQMSQWLFGQPIVPEAPYVDYNNDGVQNGFLSPITNAIGLTTPTLTPQETAQAIQAREFQEQENIIASRLGSISALGFDISDDPEKMREIATNPEIAEAIDLMNDRANSWFRAQSTKDFVRKAAEKKIREALRRANSEEE